MLLPDTRGGSITMTIGPRERRFWQLASQGCRAYSYLVPQDRMSIWYYSKSRSESHYGFCGGLTSAFIKASTDWPSRNISQYLISFTVAGLYYGGLHALAWDARFANPTQQLLWRMCSVALGASGLVVLTFPACLVAADYTPFDFQKLHLHTAVVVLYPVLVVFYLFIRIFIVVESFLSLGHTPKAVYTCIDWSNYLPKFS